MKINEKRVILQPRYIEKMKKPTVRILSILFLLLVIVSIYSFITLGNSWGLMIVFLGATIGIIMGLNFPSFTEFYIIALPIIIIVFLLGIKHRSHLLGQLVVICSIVTWIFLGVIGFGTGT